MDSSPCDLSMGFWCVWHRKEGITAVQQPIAVSRLMCVLWRYVGRSSNRRREKIRFLRIFDQIGCYRYHGRLLLDFYGGITEGHQSPAAAAILYFEVLRSLAFPSIMPGAKLGNFAICRACAWFSQNPSRPLGASVVRLLCPFVCSLTPYCIGDLNCVRYR